VQKREAGAVKTRRSHGVEAVETLRKYLLKFVKNRIA
jgi:hypothetical protein